MRADSQQGFSLIEVLVGLLVVGILAATTAVTVSGAVERARQRATMADMRSISKAIEAYAVDHSCLPVGDGSLASVVSSMTSYTGDTLPVTDRWGNHYRYAVDPSMGYTLESFGRDGLDGANFTAELSRAFERDLVLRNGIFVAPAE